MEIKEAKVGYHGSCLIGDINLTVDAGEIVTIIGKNGVGKSTILKTITRQLQLVGGTVTIGETDLVKATSAEIAKKLSMVMTDRVKTELMTCRDVVETGRYPYTGKLGILSKEDHAIVDEVILLTNCEDVADCDFMEISDGQKQRVLFARALAQKPELLILDEPTSFLDIKYKLELLGLVKKLAKEQDIAVVMSLHELDFARAVSDKIVCVTDGRIDRVGSPEEVFDGAYIHKLYDLDADGIDPCFAKIVQDLCQMH